jgi:hypothetical protein
MPNKENSSNHRLVVEEVEVPTESPNENASQEVESPKPDILDEGVKVSSQEVNKSNVIQTKSENFVDITKPVKQKSPVFWILIPGVFILGAILGGIIFYQKQVNSTNTVDTPKPVASTIVSPTPTSSPSASIDISKFDIAIFNGSGIAGEAGKVKTLLETAGFTVTSTGNAATYDYTKTIIKAKSTVDASTLKKVKDALSEAYTVGDNQTLSSTSTTDIQVVVGSSKAE